MLRKILSYFLQHCLLACVKTQHVCTICSADDNLYVLLIDLLSFSWQMSPPSRDLHFEYLLPCVKIRCRSSIDSSIDVFLLISLSLSQSHINPAGSTFAPRQDWVFRGSLCKADKHLDDATHISMPWSIQIHCWDSESRLHFFNRTSPVAAVSSRHKLCWVL